MTDRESAWAVRSPEGDYVTGRRGRWLFQTRGGAVCSAKWVCPGSRYGRVAEVLPEGYEIIRFTLIEQEALKP